MAALLILLLVGLQCTISAATTADKPHILFIMADDFGWNNIGYRSNIANTPNLDELARLGMKLERHYVYQFCSPTRSSFLSGRLPIHVNTLQAGAASMGGVTVKMTMIAAKLKKAGCATHQTGKWHAGQTSEQNMPINRGFDTSFGYLGGEEDHYTQQAGNNVDLWRDDAPAHGENGTYGAFMYNKEAVSRIEQHDPNTPFFMYIAWQNTHTPNEVPDIYLNASLLKLGPPLLQTYQGMAACLDEGIGNVTKALKKSGMWDNTLIVFSSDNGGPQRPSKNPTFGGNNYPLRGQKFTDFEGGVRVNALVSGGYLPQKLQGTESNGYIHVCDWYATFCHLAGVDPTDDAAGIPSTDSINMWDYLSGGGQGDSPRTDIAISEKAVISGQFKYIVDQTVGCDYHTGPIHPNGTDDARLDGCKNGCLFNIFDDPGESNDLSSKQPDVLDRLKGLLANQTIYQTKDNFTDCITHAEATEKYGGFDGPLCK